MGVRFMELESNANFEKIIDDINEYLKTLFDL